MPHIGREIEERDAAYRIGLENASNQVTSGDLLNVGIVWQYSIFGEFEWTGRMMPRTSWTDGRVRTRIHGSTQVAV